jgi:NAD(P)-dependent dehydrogenase (short-subunit alcohol dehydrogenase family)
MEIGMKTWTFDDIPDLVGRTAIVTGANSGIGLETARMLAQKGADVVLACRSREKGEDARSRILATRPAGTPTVLALDLSDLDSVAAFVQGFASSHDRLDLLIDNAGVMVPPLGRTKQGFELQLGVNHLGHAALTARLLPLLGRTPGARVVVVSSSVHHAGRIAFDDLNWERRPYSAWQGYAQSKLANLLFSLELERRLQASGSGVKVTAAHPGWTATELQRNTPLTRLFNPLFAMKPEGGALPTLRAATDPDAPAGSYWGPARFFEMRGPPVPARISPRAQDEAVAARLWKATEELISLSFDLRSAKAAEA